MSIFRIAYLARRVGMAGALLVSTVSWGTEAMTPPPGTYAFNWLKPTSAKCMPLSEKTIAQFKHCTFAKDGGSFGLSHPFYTCTVNKNVEYLAYTSKAACVEAKETMDANAP